MRKSRFSDAQIVAMVRESHAHAMAATYQPLQERVAACRTIISGRARTQHSFADNDHYDTTPQLSTLERSSK